MMSQIEIFVGGGLLSYFAIAQTAVPPELQNDVVGVIECRPTTFSSR